MSRTADPHLAALVAALPGAVATRAADRLRLAHDASHYLLHPRAVVTPADADQVAALLRHSRRSGTPLTFRSGGTSLSGQAVTDQLLVDTRRHFRELTVLDDGRRVRVQPGVVLRQVNNRLAPYGRKLGPDPASESACTIGGVVANNSSGMTCGTEFNTYRTLESLLLVLPSGTVLDTGAPDADERLRAAEPELHAGLLRLRDRVRGNPDSVRRVRAQYAMKNTMGYGVNAFLDHDSPSELLTRLVVGSEGTLAFVAAATFRTVPVHRHAATGLLVFDDLARAMAAMPALVAAGPAAVELLDAAALRVAQLDPQADAALRGLAVREHAALLVEWQEADPDALADRVDAARPVLADLPLSAPARLSGEAAARAALWHIRKGLYAAVAGARPSGTTALLEDIAVPVDALAETCAELADLFARHRYEESVIFGHAKDGNLHFMLNERFSGGEAPERYAAFTEEMVDAVLAHGGTLKAEHGTGRVMAPYVRRQFGDELYAVMRELKTLCDPDGVLNPGVLLSDDPDVHLRHLKTVPTVEPEVDRCVECGYCEPVCPSRDLTTTPRQRIVLRREIAAAQADGDERLARELQDDYDYDAVDTCAVDGMCATACPVLINTGDLVKRLRAERNGGLAQAGWRGAATRWGAATRGMARGLDLAGSLPPALPESATRAARAVLGAERVPQWRRDLPRGGEVRRPNPVDDPDAVFVPSCLGTLFAPAEGGPGVAAALLTLAERAGVRLLVPDGIAAVCCGTPWSSKGLTAGYQAVRDRVSPALRAASRDGTLPVVSDAASCTEGFAKLVADGGDAVGVVDAVAYAATALLPRLTVRRRLGSLALHPTCSSTRLGLDEALLAVARAVADEVVVPDGWQCCGFAGDRGLLHPELTAAATRAETRAVSERHFDGYASVNRTCEIGMARATGQPYRHLLELLEEATR
ncbi:FAD-binding and (Fe-S)-binding domain-containing protein [Micromonospora sp. 4G57]|uniref:D-lactate dehydrogenase (cytochrome) n=1 Tax=Micromonospora sicca TaxID=2202420 RepID=A0ABU5J6G0_9ACTN|nr:MULTISPECIES: FAD-binding and (Fe-S)-binding domain-containing protein [unclassified Micromonospora]MDZ5443118.1 FAD-binding and (Fe-S)-binding domain-containing protein [Micromonospora sp. 4G57]MDZ5488170.1 FAD-binding and (Fe-S)-binding domain-containing protein [Micromonospora sp. 4G53]